MHNHALITALLPAAILLGTACSGGYEAQQQASIPPQEMSESQLVEAMNDVGETNRSQRWRYRLTSPCQLSVKRSGKDSFTAQLPLGGATLRNVYDRGSDIYGVTLEPAEGSDSAVTIFSTNRWTGSVKLLTLLQVQQRRCIKLQSDSAES